MVVTTLYLQTHGAIGPVPSSNINSLTCAESHLESVLHTVETATQMGFKCGALTPSSGYFRICSGLHRSSRLVFDVFNWIVKIKKH